MFGEIRYKKFSAKTLQSSIIILLMIFSLVACSVISIKLLIETDQEYKDVLDLSH